MSENQEVLKNRLQQLLNRKKSKRYYAQKLGITESDVSKLMDRIRLGEEAINDCIELSNYVTELEDHIVKFEEDINKGTGEMVLKVKEEIKTLDELIEKCKIDTNKWKIDRYVQNFWGSDRDPHWQVKAFMSLKTEKDNFQREFTDFLKTYNSPVFLIKREDKDPFKPNASLIINKQDEHINKFDINGDNSMGDRFIGTLNSMLKVIYASQATNNIEDIYYIIGSDQFNSEWTQATTKGTPQSNIIPYQDSFKLICDYEIETISMLAGNCERLHVIYIPGNHDEYVGWHLIHWLQGFFRNSSDIKFDISTKYTKFISYGNSAMMFNHGDAMKPEKLAGIFPIQYKDEWSKAENYYIFTGDKHHEVSKDINGIKFYQIPALSNAKSLWDEKNGHVCSPAELTAFLIEDVQGMTAIFKQKI